KKSVNIAPVLFGGLHNNIRYGNWSLDFSFQFVKQKALSPVSNTSPLGSDRNNLSQAVDYYAQGNLTASFQLPALPTNAVAAQAYENYKISDKMIIDGSYIRLKTLQLQYGWQMKNSKNTRVSVFAQGQNLFTITS